MKAYHFTHYSYAMFLYAAGLIQWTMGESSGWVRSSYLAPAMQGGKAKGCGYFVWIMMKEVVGLALIVQASSTA